MRKSGSSMHARPYISSRSAIWVRVEKEGRRRNAACGGDDGKTREGEAEEFRRIQNKNHTATVKNFPPSPTRVKTVTHDALLHHRCRQKSPDCLFLFDAIYHQHCSSISACHLNKVISKIGMILFLSCYHTSGLKFYESILLLLFTF